MGDKIYLKFNDPTSEQEMSPDSPFKKAALNAIIRILEKVIPKANPDFENLIEKVYYWKIEYNLKEKHAWREIGFDKNEQAILAMPLGNNYGYWTDNQLTLDDYKNFNPTEVTQEEFDNDWAEFELKYKR